MTTLRQRPTARHLLCAALLALLLAQGLSLAHAIAHAVGAGGAPARADVAAADDHGSHRAGSPLCQLYDQLLIGQAPVAEPPGLAPLPAPGTPSATADTPAARQAPTAAYDARGPPAA